MAFHFLALTYFLPHPPPHVYTKGILKEINPELFIGRTDAEVEAPNLWLTDVKSWFIGKRPWCWERLRAGREGGERGWDDWMASLTQWAWVWANCERYWRSEKSGMLQSIGSQSQTQLKHIRIHSPKIYKKKKSKFVFSSLMWHTYTIIKENSRKRHT